MYSLLYNPKLIKTTNDDVGRKGKGNLGKGEGYTYNTNAHEPRENKQTTSGNKAWWF